MIAFRDIDLRDRSILETECLSTDLAVEMDMKILVVIVVMRFAELVTDPVGPVFYRMD